MRALIKGLAIVLGDHVDSEQLHPACFFSLDPERVKSGLFKGMDERIQQLLQSGSILFAGRNFGCGSSREVIIQAILYNKIQVIIAESFSRIFFRNAINNGLLLIEYPEATKIAVDSDQIVVEIVSGYIQNVTQDKMYKFASLDPFFLNLLERSNKKGRVMLQ